VESFLRLKVGALVQRTVRLARSGNKPTVLAPALIAHSDALTDQPTAGAIATTLKAASLPHPTRGDCATKAVVYGLKRFQRPSRYQRLRAQGYGTQEESTERCGGSVQTGPRWRTCGWRQAAYDNDPKASLYAPCFEG
jgi:hypothetical protein